jgi:hypothetical protein
VDLTSGALVALTLQPADEGDSSSIHKTLEEAQAELKRLELAVEELVADKGYRVLTFAYKEPVFNKREDCAETLLPINDLPNGGPRGNIDLLAYKNLRDWFPPKNRVHLRSSSPCLSTQPVAENEDLARVAWHFPIP